MTKLTKLQWVKSQLTKSYNDEDTKEWIQYLLDGPLSIDKVYSMVLHDLHKTFETNGNKRI